VYVIRDIPEQTPWLIGNDFLRTSLGTLSYINKGAGPEPLLEVNLPEYVQCTVYYVAPRSLLTCRAHYKLNPKETLEVDFELPQAAQVVESDQILITAKRWEYIAISPSRDTLSYNVARDSYAARGLVTNTSSYRMEGYIEGKFELINQFEAIEVCEKNRTSLIAAMETFPLARELLDLGDIDPAYVPVAAINEVTAIHQQDIQVSDLDLADTIMEKEPTYSGPAPMDPAVIEPHGIDLPTVIFKDAREAIDLTKYDSHIRPYIENIFIKKFPHAVSLHALDSGNFSLTLGYTQLRLREGETLPRAKRIFHISPSDRRHLDDICDF